MEALTQLVQHLAATSPHIASLLLVIGSFRLLAKPLFIFLADVAEKTDWNALEKFLQFVEQSKIMRAIFFLFDYIGSIKLPESKRKRAEKAIR